MLDFYKCITIFHSFWCYYKLRQHIIANYSRYYKLGRCYKLTVRTEYIHILPKALITCNTLFVNVNEIVFILLTKYRHIVLFLYATFLPFDLFLTFLLLN